MHTLSIAAAAKAGQSSALPAAEAEVERLRMKIDRVDDLLVALVQERLDHAAAIARCKTGTEKDRLLIRPERERQVVARIQAKATPRSNAVLAGLWRELMAQCLQVQQPAEIVIHAEQEPVLVTDRARLRFGCAAPLSVAMDAESALHHARLRPAIAVIELHPLSSWWVTLHGDPGLVVFDGIKDAEGRVVALAIGRVSERYVARGETYAIVSEGQLRRRMAAGEAIRALALCGRLRLCVTAAGEVS